MGILLCLMSQVMYVAEKLAICLAAVGIVTCLLFTILMMLSLGIGLGYNYCFVEFKTKHRYRPGYYQYTVRPATYYSPKTIPPSTPYPTLYPPDRVWWYYEQRRRANLLDRNLTDFYNDVNATDFEKLNISLALSTQELFNDTNYNSYLGSNGSESVIEKPDTYYIVDDDDVKEIANETTTEPAMDALNVTKRELDARKVSYSSSKKILQINGLDLIALLTKLKSENKNYTISIETT